MHIHHLTFDGPSRYLSSFPSNRPKSKISVFDLFPCPSAKKISGSCTLNFDATNLPHSRFELLYPKVFRGTLKVERVSSTSARPPAPSKVSISEKLSVIFGIFRCFLGLILDKLDFPGQTVNFWSLACHTYSESYCSDGNLNYKKDIF